MGKKRRGATLTNDQLAEIVIELQSGNEAAPEQLKDATVAHVKDII